MGGIAVDAFDFTTRLTCNLSHSIQFCSIEDIITIIADNILLGSLFGEKTYLSITNVVEFLLGKETLDIVDI